MLLKVKLLAKQKQKKRIRPDLNSEYQVAGIRNTFGDMSFVTSS